MIKARSKQIISNKNYRSKEHPLQGLNTVELSKKFYSGSGCFTFSLQNAPRCSKALLDVSVLPIYEGGYSTGRWSSAHELNGRWNKSSSEARAGRLFAVHSTNCLWDLSSCGYPPEALFAVSNVSAKVLNHRSSSTTDHYQTKRKLESAG